MGAVSTKWHASSLLGSASETGFFLLLPNLHLEPGGQFAKMLAFYISFSLSLMKEPLLGALGLRLNRLVCIHHETSLGVAPRQRQGHESAC